MNKKPYVWQMVKEAVENSGGKSSYKEIRGYIKEKYGDINESTINAQIIVITVNHSSRIHYPVNKKPRIANTNSDVLFSTGIGEVELYKPEKHGTWEITNDDFGKLVVKKLEEDLAEPDEPEPDGESKLTFPFESHLRDFIAQNLESIEINGNKLMLYVDDEGRAGVEYRIGVGFIDILAIDENGNFVVFELKLNKGIDSALGQILRYMGWIKTHLALDKEVKGVIVSKKADNRLKYATSIVSDISLFEYELDFKVDKVELNSKS